MSLPSRATAGALVGFVAALAETVGLLTHDGATAIGGAAFALVVLYTSIGAAAGIVLGVAEASLRASGWWPSWRDLGRRDQRRAATAYAVFVTVTLSALCLQRLASMLGSRMHDPSLLAWALALAALGVAAVALVAVAIVRLLFERALRRAPRLASLRAALGVALGVGSAAYVGALWARPALLSWPARVGLPASAALYVLACVGLGRSGGRLSWLCLAVPVLTLVGALGFGDMGPARTTVERDSWGGASAVRWLQTATDLDGDGHSRLFGGGDCDDFDASRFPGARDAAHDCVSPTSIALEHDAFGYGALAELPPGALLRPNIVLVTVDALRPDHLGCFGYQRAVSPHLDELCEQSVRFDRVVAPSSRSIRSLPSMMTGLYPTQLRFGGQYQWPDLVAEQTTVAERLRSAGYETSAFLGTRYFERAPGLFQGFDDVTHGAEWKARDGDVMDAALPLGSARPFFLWLHLFHTHTPYLDDDEPSRFGPESLDRYDTEVWRADRQIGRLLDHLAERGLVDSTVVIVASDHGEAFGEHGHDGHSRTLYAEETLATLLVRAPGFAPRVVRRPVGLYDLAPTILNLTRLEPTWQMTARSLVPAMMGRPGEPSRVLFAELLPDGMVSSDQRAVWTSDGWVLLRWVPENRIELYSLDGDPTQRDELSFAHPAVRDRLLDRIVAHEHVGDATNRRSEVLAAHRLSQLPSGITRTSRRVDGVGTILGWRVHPEVVRPNDQLTIELFIEADPDMDDHLFHLSFHAPPGVRLPWRFGADYTPVGGHYPTSQWRSGELLRDRVVMTVPELGSTATLSLRFHATDASGSPSSAVELSRVTLIGGS